MALTVGLLKQNESKSALNAVREILQNFSEEIGSFLGLQELDQQSLNPSISQSKYALRFERCTLNIDLIANARTNTQVVNSFHLR